jgi:hypothetical protein
MIYTKAPTNPCNSPLNTFYSDKSASLKGPWAFSKTNQVYEAPFRTHEGHIEKFADDTQGRGMKNNYISCPKLDYGKEGSVLNPMPLGDGIKAACYHPTPQIQWYKFGSAIFTSRKK